MIFATRCILGLALILGAFGLNACSSSRVSTVSHAESANGAASVEHLSRHPQPRAATPSATGLYWCDYNFCTVDFDASEDVLAANAADCVDAAFRLEALTPGSLHGYHNHAYEEYFRCMAPLAELVDARIVADIIRPLLNSPEPLSGFMQLSYLVILATRPAARAYARYSTVQSGRMCWPQRKRSASCKA